MSNYDTKIHSNPDAQAWAKFFIQTKEEKNWQIEDIDESLMIAWFANAMMAMHDHLKSQRKPLTDEECDNLWAAQSFDITDRLSARDFIRDVEDAHGIWENT